MVPMAVSWDEAFACSQAQLFGGLLMRPQHPAHPPWWCIGTPWCFTAAERAYDPAAAQRHHAFQQLDQGPAVG